MPDLRFTVSQAIQKWAARQLLNAYPRTWKRIIADFQENLGPDAFWLTYAANYLLRTADVHWALDPLSLTSRVGQCTHLDFPQDLSSLQLIVLSHIHSDHLDPNLLAALRDLPITWVIPRFMRDQVLSILPVDPTRLIVPEPGVSITFGKLVLTPFNALHFSVKCLHGVPEMGYLAEFSGKRWLFPGDTRNYDIKALPDFGKLDGVLAHCWLGRGKALQPDENIVSEFCQFYRSLDTARVIVTHLHDFGRGPDDFWGRNHFRLIKKHYNKLSPGAALGYALMGSRITL